MRMKKNLLASLAVASTIGFLTPLTSQAFGLGKLELMSALNEPFKAEIDITALRPEEKDNLQVKMASSEEFEKAGLDRSMLLSQLQFDIVSRQDGTKILVTSKQAIKEPFLDFLLTATAGSGRLLREYTVLLDPPAYVMAETRSATTQAAPAPQAPVETTTSSTTRYQYADTAYDGSAYSVKRNDTLWNVALKTRPSDAISVHQMMMALLEKNPAAFTKRNVNGLKAGVTLQIPSQSETTVLSKSAAAAAFSEQNTAWKNRNKTAAPASTVTETATEDEAMPAVSESSAADTESSDDSAAEQAALAELEAQALTDNEGRLQLVAPDAGVTNEDDASPNVAGDDQLQKLTEQLTLAQETIEAQKQDNIDFNARMQAMEEQLETMRRMISLKDEDLARMQSRLQEEDPALAAEIQAELQATDAEAVIAEDATSEQIEPQAEMAADVAPAVEQTPVEQQTSVAEVSEADSLVMDAAKALNLDEKEVQSVIAKVKQFISENKLQSALGLLLILLVLWLIARRSNREVTWDEAVKKMDKQQPAQDGPVVVTPVASDGENNTDAPLADETDEKTVGELVEQADMFVGYADYVQAKNALEQAKLQEPDNTLVAYKMLFVLYKQQQADDFVALAEETNFEQDSFEWDEVKQWGQELAPAHDLFKDAPAEQNAIADQPEPTELAEANETITTLQDDSDEVNTIADTNLPDAAEMQQEPIEFDLNDFAATPVDADEANSEADSTASSTDKDDDLLSFDTNLGQDDSIETDEALELDAADESSDDDLSFDLDVPADELDVAIDNDDEEPDLEFDVGDLDDIDEAETKLDLAAAYIDMDDPDGAKSILNEVLVEGNEEQKNRAHSLLDTLS